MASFPLKLETKPAVIEIPVSSLHVEYVGYLQSSKQLRHPVSVSAKMEMSFVYVLYFAAFYAELKYDDFPLRKLK